MQFETKNLRVETGSRLEFELELQGCVPIQSNHVTTVTFGDVIVDLVNLRRPPHFLSYDVLGVNTILNALILLQGSNVIQKK